MIGSEANRGSRHRRRARSERPLLSSCLAAALTCVVLTAASSSYGADPIAAQTLFNDAKKLMTEGKFAEACIKLEESQKLDPGMGTLFNLAECHASTGRIASAWAEYLDVASQAKAQQQTAREKAARERATALEGKLPRLTISVEPDQSSSVVVKRDGVEVGRGQWGSPIFVDPGVHTIVASAPGKRSWQTQVTVAASAASTSAGSNPTDATPAIASVNVPVLEPEPASNQTAASGDLAKGDGSSDNNTSSSSSDDTASSGGGGNGTTMRRVSFVLGGVGLVGVVLGTVFGLQSKSKHDDSVANCDANNHCNQSGVDLRNDARSAGTISTIAFVAGGVALAGGVVLYLLAPKSSASASAAAQARRRLHVTPLAMSTREHGRLGGLVLEGAW